MRNSFYAGYFLTEGIVKNSKLAIWLQELRAPFFTASVIPVLVGTTLAYSAAGGAMLSLGFLLSGLMDS